MFNKLAISIFCTSLLFSPLSFSEGVDDYVQSHLSSEDLDLLKQLGERVKAVSTEFSKLDSEYNEYLEQLPSWSDENAWRKWEIVGHWWDTKFNSIENEMRRLRNDYSAVQSKIDRLRSDYYYNNFDWSNFNWSLQPQPSLSYRPDASLGLVLVESINEGGMIRNTWISPPNK